jgi:Holliday junction resolvase
VVNKPKQRGTRFETALVGFLREHGFPFARRLALAGGSDLGDLSLGDQPSGGPVVIEAKDHAKIDLAGFVDEMLAECANADNDYGVVVVKRRRKGIEDSYVVTTLGQWTRDRTRDRG